MVARKRVERCAIHNLPIVEVTMGVCPSICPNCCKGMLRMKLLEAGGFEVRLPVCDNCGWTPVCFYCKRGGGGVDVELLKKIRIK